MGHYLQNVITSLGGSPRDVLFCSNLTALNPLTNYPITDLSSPNLPITSADSVYGAKYPVTHTNFLQFLNLPGKMKSVLELQSFSLNQVKPCVYNFGKRGFTKKLPYGGNPHIGPDDEIFASDSLFQNEPLGGFLSPTILLNLAQEVIVGQMNEQFLLGWRAPEIGYEVGTAHHGHVVFNNSDFFLDESAVPSLGFYPMNTSMGILDTIEFRFYLDFDQERNLLVGYQKVPSFSLIHNATSTEDLQNQTESLVENTVKLATSIDTNIFLSPNPSNSDLLSYLDKAKRLAGNAPFGALFFESANSSTAQYNYTFIIGREEKLERLTGFPERNLRRILLQAQLSNGFLRGSDSNLSEAVISQSLRAFPVLSSTVLDLKLGSLIGQIMYPFGISFLMLYFAVCLMKDKETKVLAMMLSVGVKNGASEFIYSAAQYTVFLALYSVSMLVWRKWKSHKFVERMSKGANTRAAFMPNETPYSLSRFGPGDEVYRCVCALLVEAAVVYCASFCVSQGICLRSNGFSFSILQWKINLWELASKLAVADARPVEHGFQDVEGTGHSQRAYAALEMRNLRKLYGSARYSSQSIAALDGINLCIQHNEIFGLLGHNGAGKSTLVSIITKMAHPSEGKILLNGKDIFTAGNVIGVCTQEDLLWENLTVEEHLLFYWRLKNSLNGTEKERLQVLMKQMHLDHVADRLVSTLSGGERRRLSIAIAFTGCPALVILDEPTTGLDVIVRKQIWEMLRAIKNKTVILTTHGLDEASFCCDRIGIMAQGRLKFVGEQLALRNAFGNYATLTFSSTSVSSTYMSFEHMDLAMSEILPVGWTRKYFGGYHFQYEFPVEKGDVTKVIKMIEASMEKLNIFDWDLKQTTLENTFFKLASEQ
ncbi:hypothetical protein HDU84_002451 [Entophlyctis sp. JEL0112]|nr:hypothetical protein HDU84_002451 [Entophlyctis sp. JEL0112]